MLIQAVAQRDADNFAAKMADSSLEAAVDIWLRRIARRKVSPAVRTRLVRAVERGDAAETKDVQLTRAALLRKAGLDERPAAAAAIAAGATYTEVGAVLGMTQQGASARIRPYLAARTDTTRSAGMSPDAAPVDRHVVIVTAAGSFNAAGERLTGPVDAVDKLEKLIDWAHQRGGLQPLPVGDGDTEPARVWLVGGACSLLVGSPAAANAAVTEQTRTGAGAAGHPRVGTARQADDGA